MIELTRDYFKVQIMKQSPLGIICCWLPEDSMRWTQKESRGVWWRNPLNWWKGRNSNRGDLCLSLIWISKVNILKMKLRVNSIVYSQIYWIYCSHVFDESNYPAKNISFPAFCNIHLVSCYVVDSDLGDQLEVNSGKTVCHLTSLFGNSLFPPCSILNSLLRSWKPDLMLYI